MFNWCLLISFSVICVSFSCESFVDVTMIFFCSASVELRVYESMPSETAKEIIPEIDLSVTESKKDMRDLHDSGKLFSVYLYS